MAHALGVVTVGQRAEGAKWTCSCGACGFCWPDGWTPDEDQRALALWADAQEAHRHHAMTATPPGCDPRMHRRTWWYCRGGGDDATA